MPPMSETCVTRVTNPDPLNLPGLTVVRSFEQEHQYTFVAQANGEPAPCDCRSPSFVRFGRRQDRFRDLPIHGKFVEVVVDRQRYRCKQCGKTRSSKLPFVDDHHRMTTRLTQHIFSTSAKATFSDVGGAMGVPESTVRDVFVSRAEPVVLNWRPATPRVLGIDEVRIGGHFRCVIGDVEERRILDLLDSRKKADIDKRFSDMPDKDRVEVVTMDMYGVYRDLARRHFPNAAIVADKFHVVRMGNKAVNDLRKRIRGKVSDPEKRLELSRGLGTISRRRAIWDASDEIRAEAWELEYPTLMQAHRYKEEWADIFRAATTKQEARINYIRWKILLPADVRPEFDGLIRTADRWGEQIFDYFDHPYTNAYIEALNGLVRDLHNSGRGYDLKTLKFKAILAFGQRREKRRFEPLSDTSFASVLSNFGDGPDLERNFGIPIALLREWVKVGRL